MMVQTKISHTRWGRYRDAEVYRFRLENTQGAVVELTNYGATLISVVVPDKAGCMENVVLGFPSLEGYLHDVCYIGSTIGRYANRIRDARFRLGDMEYTLEANDNGNTNHGGPGGFHDRVFDFELLDNGVAFTLQSADGEGGYPGNLRFKVTYTWDDDNMLSIGYSAVSDKQTVVNFTNHAYFNLSAGRENILKHMLTVHAKEMLESGPGFLPTGRVVQVGDQSFTGHRIAERLTIADGDVRGLNTYYITGAAGGMEPTLACTLADAVSGRRLDVYTTYPGLMLYTGDYLQSEYPGHGGVRYKAFEGVCLECQYYPDSPSHASFPSTVLEAGARFEEQIVMRFGIITL